MSSSDFPALHQDREDGVRNRAEVANNIWRTHTLSEREIVFFQEFNRHDLHEIAGEEASRASVLAVAPEELIGSRCCEL